MKINKGIKNYALGLMLSGLASRVARATPWGRKTSSFGTLTTLLTGAGIGAATTWLLTPKAKKRTRGALFDR